MKNILDWESLSFAPPYLAYSVKDAKEIINSHRIHILISDIEMIGADGFALVDWVQENYPNILRIFLTNHARFDYAQKAIRLGISEYLLKPVNEQSLTELLKKCTAQLQNISGEDEGEPMYSEVIRKAIKYINQNLSTPLSRDSIARELYISESNLSRSFTKEVGMTLIDYITECRLEEAKKLLVHTDLSVTQICSRIGYNYAAYFAKIFKEKENMTPKQFREQGRRKKE